MGLREWEDDQGSEKERKSLREKLRKSESLSKQSMGVGLATLASPIETALPQRDQLKRLYGTHTLAVLSNGELPRNLCGR